MTFEEAESMDRSGFLVGQTQLDNVAKFFPEAAGYPRIYILKIRGSYSWERWITPDIMQYQRFPCGDKAYKIKHQQCVCRN